MALNGLPKKQKIGVPKPGTRPKGTGGAPTPGTQEWRNQLSAGYQRMFGGGQSPGGLAPQMERMTAPKPQTMQQPQTMQAQTQPQQGAPVPGTQDWRNALTAGYQQMHAGRSKPDTAPAPQPTGGGLAPPQEQAPPEAQSGPTPTQAPAPTQQQPPAPQPDPGPTQQQIDDAQGAVDNAQANAQATQTAWRQAESMFNRLVSEGVPEAEAQARADQFLRQRYTDLTREGGVGDMTTGDAYSEPGSQQDAQAALAEAQAQLQALRDQQAAVEAARAEQEAQAQNADPAPVPETEDPAYDERDENVSDILNQVTDQNGRLMRMAETQGRQMANQRGLLNSSMAVDAAQDAAYRAAIPLAQQQAEINAGRNLSRQDFEQNRALQGEQFEQEAMLQTRQFQQDKALLREELANRLEITNVEADRAMERLKAELTSREGIASADREAEEKNLIRQIEAEFGLQEAEAQDLIERLKLEIQGEKEITELDIAGRERIAATEIAGRLQLEDAQAANLKERLRMEIRSQEGMQGEELDFERFRLAEEIAAEYGLQEQEILAEMEIQENDIRARREEQERDIAARFDLTEFEAREARSRLETQLESERDMNDEQIRASRDELTMQIARDYGIQEAEAEDLLERTRLEIEADKELQARDFEGRGELLDRELEGDKELETLRGETQKDIERTRIAGQKEIEGQRISAETEQQRRELEQRQREVETRAKIDRERMKTDLRLNEQDNEALANRLEMQIASEERMTQAQIDASRAELRERIQADYDLTELEADRAMERLQADQDFEGGQRDLDREQRELDRETQRFLETQRQDFDRQIADMNLGADRRNQASDAFTRLSAGMSQEITGIMANTKMKADARQDAIDDVYTRFREDAAVIGDLYGIDFSFGGDDAGSTTPVDAGLLPEGLTDAELAAIGQTPAPGSPLSDRNPPQNDGGR